MTQLNASADGGGRLRYMEPVLLNKRDAAAVLRISPRTLDYWIATRGLPARKIGKRVMIVRAELMEWIDSQPVAVRSRCLARPDLEDVS